MSLNNIVNVQITRETKVPTQKGFGTLLIVGESEKFAERVRAYSSIDDVAADFAVTDPEYIWAQSAFSQSVQPEELKIGSKKTGDADWPTALDAIVDENDDWYGLSITDRAQANILAVAAWTEARIKLFFTSTDESDVIDGVASNTLEQLNTLGYDRTIYLWSGEAAAKGPEAGWAGGLLPKPPGSITWKFKEINGIAFDDLTTQQKNNVFGFKGNTYTRIAGVDITEEGTVVSGEFIDVMRGADFIQARLQENIYFRLVNADKIPYTEQGADVIVNEIRAVLRTAVGQGILAPDPEFTVTRPSIADISAIDKGNRCLPDVEFEGTLAGAIHKVKIRGRLVL